MAPASGMLPDQPLSPIRLGQGLLIALALSLFHPWLNDYICFRVDHLTQLPLLYLKHDPGLFPRDWFLQNYGHFRVRFFHLMLVDSLGSILGYPLALLALFVVCYTIIAASWMLLARRLFGSAWYGVVAVLTGIYFSGWELGNNQVFENSLIPRVTAMACCQAGLCMLLVLPRPWLAGLAGGLALAVGGYFQTAISLVFALPLLLWLPFRGGAGRWPRFLCFAGAWALVLLPYLMYIKGALIAEAGLSDALQIQLAAVIRHPHHMKPLLWREKWLYFAALMSLVALLRPTLREAYPRAWKFGRLAWVMVGLLALLTVFISLFPIKKIVLLQPYRMCVLLYTVFFFLLAPHFLRLFLSGGFLEMWRLVGIFKGNNEEPLILPLLVLECVFVAFERAGRPLKAKWAALLLVVCAYTPGIVLGDDVDYLTGEILLWAFGLHFLMRHRGDWLARLRLPDRLPLAWIAFCTVWISALYMLPLESWMTRNPDASFARRPLAKHLWNYQFKPTPLTRLERVGQWAREHTPRDALFLLPPGRKQDGFRIWSKRSVYFMVKFFPYNPTGMAEWRDRYLTCRGLAPERTSPDDPRIEAAMQDVGAAGADEDYEHLPVDYVLWLMDKEGIDYFVTQQGYDHPRLEELHRTHDLDTSQRRENNRLLVYRVRPSASEGVGPEGVGQ